MANNEWSDKESGYPIPTVTIRTVDQAVHDYFDKKLAANVDTPDGRKKVPVMMATGERWKLIRDQKGIRDENKVLILPLITIQRLDIDRTPGFGGMALEVPSITVAKRIHKETNLNQNLYDQRNRFWPTAKKNKAIYEITTIPFPDFSIVYYQILIWAQQMSQMNEILEKIFYSYDYMDSFVMPVHYDQNKPLPKGEGYYFVGFREGASLSAQTNFDEFTDDERIIRYQYNIKVPAYFILNPKDLPTSYGKERGYSKNEGGKNIVYKTQTSDQVHVEARDERELTVEEAAKLYDILL